MSHLVRINDEPLCVCADDAVQALRHIGWEKCADLVSRLNKRDSEPNVEVLWLRKHNSDLRERLHVYEPPERYQPLNHQPPPEASD